MSLHCKLCICTLEVQIPLYIVENADKKLDYVLSGSGRAKVPLAVYKHGNTISNRAERVR